MQEDEEALGRAVLAFLARGLDDISVSRSRTRARDWGLTVPDDPTQVIYVWWDALGNYVTALDYGGNGYAYEQWWRGADQRVHVIGKGILRFHAVIWPAMLMAAGLEVPKGIFAHGWLLVGGEKMSKSKLTGIAPTEITDVFGSDAYRFYFLSAIAFGQDGSFSWEDLSARYQAELANGFGNLASRTVAMNGRYFDGVVPEPTFAGAESDLPEVVASAVRRYDEEMLAVRPTAALAAVFDLVRDLNRRIEARSLSTDDAGRALDRVRDLDRVLAVLPEASEERLDADLQALLDERAAARAARDWAASDRLRDALADRGVTVEDTRDGQRWRRIPLTTRG